MVKVIYTGSQPEVEILFRYGTIKAKKGKPIEITAEEYKDIEHSPIFELFDKIEVTTLKQKRGDK